MQPAHYSEDGWFCQYIRLGGMADGRQAAVGRRAPAARKSSAIGCQLADFLLDFFGLID
jgi:hypothetical protein